jgi:hypothetical protein
MTMLVSSSSRPITYRPFSAGWWTVVLRMAAAGQPIGFTVSSARRGRGLTLAASKAPTATEVALAVPVNVDSEAFEAWRRHWFRRYGAVLPKPDRCRVAWLPAAMPPNGGSIS